VTTDNKMNPEIKARWLAALRSGEYKQGREALLTSTPEDAYCCLGVLCDLAVKDQLLSSWGNYLDDWYSDGRADPDLLPGPVQDWAGLASQSPRVPVSVYEARSLSCLNDEGGLSFLEIAALIEEHL
jgi:hypothetical protein